MPRRRHAHRRRPSPTCLTIGSPIAVRRRPGGVTVGGSRRRDRGAGWSPPRWWCARCWPERAPAGHRARAQARPRPDDFHSIVDIVRCRSMVRVTSEPTRREPAHGAHRDQPLGVVEGIRILASRQAHGGTGAADLFGPDGDGPRRVGADDLGHGRAGTHRARQRADRPGGGRDDSGQHREVDHLHDRRRRAHRRHRPRVRPRARFAPACQHIDRRAAPGLPRAQSRDRGCRGALERARKERA